MVYCLVLLKGGQLRYRNISSATLFNLIHHSELEMERNQNYQFVFSKTTNRSFASTFTIFAIFLTSSIPLC